MSRDLNTQQPNDIQAVIGQLQQPSIKANQEIQNLIEHLQAIQALLQKKNRTDAACFAILIAQCFDQQMINALSLNDAEQQPAISTVENLKNPSCGSLERKTETICEFALHVESRQKATNKNVNEQYRELKSIACNDSERVYRSEAYLLLRDQLRGDKEYSKKRNEFTKKCTLSQSEKIKKIGWIMGGVLAIAALTALMVLTFGVAGAAAAVVTGVIAHLSIATAATSGAGIGVLVGGAGFQGVKSAYELSKGQTLFQNCISEIVVKGEPVQQNVRSNQSNSDTEDSDDDRGQKADSAAAGNNHLLRPPSAMPGTPINFEADFSHDSESLDVPDDLQQLINKIKTGVDLTDGEWEQFQQGVKKLKDDQMLDFTDVNLSDEVREKFNEYGRDEFNELRVISSLEQQRNAR